MALGVGRRERATLVVVGRGPTQRSPGGWVSERTAPSRPSRGERVRLAAARAEAGAPEQPLGLGGPKWPV